MWDSKSLLNNKVVILKWLLLDWGQKDVEEIPNIVGIIRKMRRKKAIHRETFFFILLRRQEASYNELPTGLRQ